MEYFITAVEVNDPEEIMAQVRNMRMCMDLPHVNLLHAGSDEREHGDRDGQEPELGSSNNNTLGRSSENTTRTAEQLRIPPRRRMTRSSKLWQKQERAYVVEFVSCSRALRAMKSWATMSPQKKLDVRSMIWKQWNLQFEDSNQRMWQLW